MVYMVYVVLLISSNLIFVCYLVKILLLGCEVNSMEELTVTMSDCAYQGVQVVNISAIKWLELSSSFCVNKRVGTVFHQTKGDMCCSCFRPCMFQKVLIFLSILMLALDPLFGNALNLKISFLPPEKPCGSTGYSAAGQHISGAKLIKTHICTTSFCSLSLDGSQ